MAPRRRMPRYTATFRNGENDVGWRVNLIPSDHSKERA